MERDRERGDAIRCQSFNLLFLRCWKLGINSWILVVASFVAARAVPVREDADADCKKHVWNDD